MDTIAGSGTSCPASSGAGGGVPRTSAAAIQKECVCRSAVLNDCRVAAMDERPIVRSEWMATPVPFPSTSASTNAIGSASAARASSRIAKIVSEMRRRRCSSCRACACCDSGVLPRRELRSLEAICACRAADTGSRVNFACRQPSTRDLNPNH